MRLGHLARYAQRCGMRRLGGPARREAAACRAAKRCEARTAPDRRLRAAIVASALLGLGMPFCAGSAPARLAAPAPVASGVYVIPGTGGDAAPENGGRVANAAAIVGPRGIVVVDSGVSFRDGEAIIAAIERLSRRPIRLLILTHVAPEVVFGAAAFQVRGIPVLMHHDAAALMAARCDACLARLVATLGERAMVGTRVVVPDRLVTGTTNLDVIGRRLRLIAPARGSTPGALAVLDPRTGTLVAGNLVPVTRVPDMRDTDGNDWRDALSVVAATHCAHLVPTFGPVADCHAVDAVDAYFATLDACARRAVAEGVGLAAVPTRCALPRFAGWDGYATLHAGNASRAFLREERASFGK
jgi:glyoxylase-like metal-dependent hydrolase (beta-lactamase superfamily II)